MAGLRVGKDHPFILQPDMYRWYPDDMNVKNAIPGRDHVVFREMGIDIFPALAERRPPEDNLVP